MRRGTLYLGLVLLITLAGCTSMSTIKDVAYSAATDYFSGKEVKDIIDSAAATAAESFLNQVEQEKTAKAAEELGIKKEDYDADGDGELNEIEKAMLAKDVFTKGKQAGWSMWTIVLVIAVLLFGDELKKGGKTGAKSVVSKVLSLLGK